MFLVAGSDAIELKQRDPLILVLNSSCMVAADAWDPPPAAIWPPTGPPHRGSERVARPAAVAAAVRELDCASGRLEFIHRLRRDFFPPLPSAPTPPPTKRAETMEQELADWRARITAELEPVVLGSGSGSGGGSSACPHELLVIIASYFDLPAGMPWMDGVDGWMDGWLTDCWCAVLQDRWSFR